MLFGDRIQLRALERDDLDALFVWWNDPALWERVGSRKRLTGREELDAWFDGELDKGAPQEGRTLAIDDEEGALIGTLWFGSYEPGDRQTTVGLYIGSAAKRGQGYGSDALKTLLRYLFEELGLHKARLLVDVDNEPAIRVYRGLGFVEEGRLREHRFYGGRFHDFLTMGLLAGELASRQSQRTAGARSKR